MLVLPICGGARGADSVAGGMFSLIMHAGRVRENVMNRHLLLIPLMLIIVPSLSFAADGMVRTKSITMGGQTLRFKVSKPSSGSGLVATSALKGVKPMCINVSLSCGDGSSASACCATGSYSAVCGPKAKITCN
jgi:hypothetical protein